MGEGGREGGYGGGGVSGWGGGGEANPTPQQSNF